MTVGIPSGRPVIEMAWGITVYPARFEGAGRMRLARRRPAAALRITAGGQPGRQAGEGNETTPGRLARHEPPRCGPTPGGDQARESADGVLIEELDSVSSSWASVHERCCSG
jgi:hypothetical protein